MTPESRPIRYDYPVHSLDEDCTFEGMKRLAAAKRAERRAARKAPPAPWHRRPVMLELVWPIVGGLAGLGALWLIFEALAALYRAGVLPIR